MRMHATTAETRPSSSLNRILRALAQPFVTLMQRWMPDAFVFALALTVLTFVLAVTVADYSVMSAINSWGGHLWDLLAFMSQIALTLITGYALAHTPLVHGLLNRTASTVSSATGAYALVCFVGMLASLFSWAVGLIVGAIIARETANACLERGIKVHYPLLVASAYSGFVVWHQGLSSSVGLAIATPNHFLADMMGIVPVSETIFSSWNLTIVAAVLLTLPFVMMMLCPSDQDCVEIDHKLEGEDDAAPRVRTETPAERIENSRIFNLVIGSAGLIFLAYYFLVGEGSLNLNIVNLIFLISGILLTSSPKHYVSLIADGGRTLGPILVQYPFYAGIMGIMLDSGLAKITAAWFVSISTAATLPVWSMISGGLINIFIPSGGGQWAVQGPIMIEAAKTLGADIPRVAMGVAIGDQWTNMIQPFWTIPALAIAGLHVRDILGYCVIALIWTGLIFAGGLLFL